MDRGGLISLGLFIVFWCFQIQGVSKSVSDHLLSRIQAWNMIHHVYHDLFVGYFSLAPIKANIFDLRTDSLSQWQSNLKESLREKRFLY